MSSSNNTYTVYTPYGGSRSAPTSPQNTYVQSQQTTNVWSSRISPQMAQPDHPYLVTITDIIQFTNKELVWTIGRTVKWIAIIDTIFAAIYAIVLWPYLFAAFFSLSGWYGAKNFKSNFILLYLIYQGFTIILRAFLMYYRPSIISTIFGIISILIEIYIIQITIKFRKMLKQLSEADELSLQTGWQPERQVQAIYY